MTENEIKKEAIVALREALNDDSKACKKARKKNKFLAKQWASATEEDIEIIYLPEVEEISEVSCRADRYYRYVFSNGLSKDKNKNNPVYFDSSEVNFSKKIYNVKIENTTEIVQDLVNYLLFSKNKNDKYYLTVNDSWDPLVFINFNKELGDLYEKVYQKKYETRLYNTPEKMEQIIISEVSILKKEVIKNAFAGIFVKIHDKKGEELRMYVGKYSKEENVTGFTALYLEQSWIYDAQGNIRK